MPIFEMVLRLSDLPIVENALSYWWGGSWRTNNSPTIQPSPYCYHALAYTCVHINVLVMSGLFQRPA